jgi:general L-amino acid transport system substrate-binding protein
MKSIKRFVPLMLVLALVAAACGDDDEGNENGNGQGTAGTLAAVQDRGTLRCGVNSVVPGFGLVDDEGNYDGFDVEFCRVIAASVLGDSTLVEYVPLGVEDRLTALQAGEIDVLIRNTTWTATRDGQEGLTFVFTTFYDGQGVMVPAASGYTTLEDLADADVCTLPATTTELNLTSAFNARGIPFNPVIIGDSSEIRSAYEAGQCEVWTSDRSQLAAFKLAIESEGGAEQLIMDEVISKEPLGPVVRDGDSEWAQVVEWSVMATVIAWEFGIDSTNVGQFTTDDPNPAIARFVGGADPALGLSTDFAVKIISQVGNYEEIYNRHVAPLGLPLDGSVNDLWINGGLMYAPPYV